MDIKQIMRSKVTFVVLTVLASIIVGLLLIWIVFACLGLYTQHGVEKEVPSVVGMYLTEADMTLKQEGLQLQVIDSTYTKQYPFGAIVQQNPLSGSKVKNGRRIYVIVNQSSLKKVPLPDLQSVSYRQAEAMLSSLGFVVGNVEYKPSEFSNEVLDVLHAGESVSSGTRLDEGSKLTLVVGRGKGNTQVLVPSVLGLTVSEAKRVLWREKLVVGAVFYDDGTDGAEDTYYVYDQSPSAKQWILEGTRVNLSVSVDQNKSAVQRENDEEVFF